MRAVLALVLAVLACSAARADDFFDFDRGNMSLGARASYWYYNNGNIQDGQTLGGAQVRVMAWILGLEASSDFRRVTLPNDGAINVFPVHADLLIFPLPWRLSPYLIAGGSWIASSRLRGQGGSAADRLGVEYGAGLEYMWDPNWSLDGEYRMLRLTDKNVPDSNAGDSDIILFSVNYHFSF